MRTKIAGATIEIRGSTWFADLGRATPIYHAWQAPREGRSATTRCGLKLANTGDGRIDLLLTPIPPRLGVRIGRPCVRCWPELQRQEPLFRDQRRRRREPAGEQLEEAL